MNGTESWERTYTAQSHLRIASPFFGVQNIAHLGNTRPINGLYEVPHCTDLQKVQHDCRPCREAARHAVMTSQIISCISS